MPYDRQIEYIRNFNTCIGEFADSMNSMNSMNSNNSAKSRKRCRAAFAWENTPFSILLIRTSFKAPLTISVW
jgi:hypothetical protein